ncbi:hypothetical protein VCR14J2_220021 [Vibrio coralliirubri]|nr:hypothetical protein VCR14J2_220021 [Vibrio coralliirubri]
MFLTDRQVDSSIHAKMSNRFTCGKYNYKKAETKVPTFMFLSY